MNKEDNKKVEEMMNHLKEEYLNTLFENLHIDKSKLDQMKNKKLSVEDMCLMSTLYRDKKGEFTLEELTDEYYYSILKEGVLFGLDYGKKIIIDDIQSNKLSKEAIINMSVEDVMNYFDDRKEI